MDVNILSEYEDLNGYDDIEYINTNNKIFTNGFTINKEYFEKFDITNEGFKSIMIKDTYNLYDWDHCIHHLYTYKNIFDKNDLTIYVKCLVTITTNMKTILYYVLMNYFKYNSNNNNKIGISKVKIKIYSTNNGEILESNDYIIDEFEVNKILLKDMLNSPVFNKNSFFNIIEEFISLKSHK